MGIEIIGGTGNNKAAGVNDDNQLETFSTVESDIEFISDVKGLAFSWSNVSYDYDAGDTILMIKNISRDKKFFIHSVILASDVATEIRIHMPSVPTPTGTPVMGVNCNRTSRKLAEAIAISDETTNSIENVVTLTRISANSPFTKIFGGTMILGLNDTIAVDFTSDGGACTTTIIGYYKPL